MNARAMERFADRYEAGRLLGQRLEGVLGRGAISVVLALPRGGVPVAAEVAKALKAPLDVFVVRKLGVPGHEELAMGAIASGGVMVVNESVVRQLGIPRDVIEVVAEAERGELLRRERLYRGDEPPLDVNGKAVVVVDDGLATGATMRAAIKALRAMKAGSITVAVPVGAPSTCDELEKEADTLVCLREPEPLYAVGEWYDEFNQTSDEEVRELLGGARKAG